MFKAQNTRYRKQSFYRSAPDRDLSKYKNFDKKQLFSTLDRVSSFKFVISDTRTEWNWYVSSRTVKSGINKGHKDMGVWMLVNQPDVTSYYNGSFFVKGYQAPKKFSNFVIDIDNFPFASSIEEMEGYLKTVGCPLPYVVQTGPKNFHLLFFTNQAKISKDTVFDFACIVAQISPSEMRKKRQRDRERYFAKFGIDTNYLSQDPSSHKARVPGSINHKYSKETPFVVGGDFFKKRIIDVSKLSFLSPTDLKMRLRSPVKPLKKQKLTRVEKLINKELSYMFSKKTSRRLSIFIYENLSFLRKGKCAISQTILAERLGIDQPNVSRAIKKLMKSGILVRTCSEFNYDETMGKIKCMEYGISSKLNERITKIQQQNKKHAKVLGTRIERVQTPYQAGSGYSQFMQDIRDLYALGATKDQAVQIIRFKNDDYLSQSIGARKRYVKEIEKTFINYHIWLKKNPQIPIRRSSGYLFNFNKIMLDLKTKQYLKS